MTKNRGEPMIDPPAPRGEQEIAPSCDVVGCDDFGIVLWPSAEPHVFCLHHAFQKRCGMKPRLMSDQPPAPPRVSGRAIPLGGAPLDLHGKPWPELVADALAGCTEASQ